MTFHKLSVNCNCNLITSEKLYAAILFKIFLNNVSVKTDLTVVYAPIRWVTPAFHKLPSVFIALVLNLLSLQSVYVADVFLLRLTLHSVTQSGFLFQVLELIC